MGNREAVRIQRIEAPGQRGLPVLIDMNWLGTTLTSENGGIVPSRSYRGVKDQAEVVL